MTTPTRRISFYLKPTAVKNEGEACARLDSLTPEARKSGQRVAFSGRAGTSENESGRGLSTGCMGW